MDARYVPRLLEPRWQAAWQGRPAVASPHPLDILKQAAAADVTAGLPPVPPERFQRVVTAFGADVARVFVLFQRPPADPLSWADAQVDGARHWLARVYRLALQQAPGAELPQAQRTLADVTVHLQAGEPHKAVAALMQLTNALHAQAGSLRLLAHMLFPLAPHLAEELWRAQGGAGLLRDVPWPEPDVGVPLPARCAVRVNGALRGHVELPAGASAEQAGAAALAVVPDLGGTLERVVWVPGRLVNLVVR